MSPSKQQPGPQGCASSKGKQQHQLSIKNFMSKPIYISEKTRITSPPGTPEKNTEKLQP